MKDERGKMKDFRTYAKPQDQAANTSTGSVQVFANSRELIKKFVIIRVIRGKRF